MSKYKKLPLEIADRLSQLGERIRMARIRRDWSIVDLAIKAGIDRKTLAALEFGQPGVTIGTFVTVLWLLGLERSLDTVAHPDGDSHGKTLEASRRPQRVRKSKPDRDKYDF